MIKGNLIAIVALVMIAGGLFARQANVAPVTELEDLAVDAAAFSDASGTKPLVLRSLRDAADYFGKEALARISTAVDFEKQIVLVFAWTGSGQDRIGYEVKKSFPEQIRFFHESGRTRDLRSHLAVFALQEHVEWTAE